METVQGPQGNLLTLQYVHLGDALEMRWPGNPKRHDIVSLATSIKLHGFRDPSIYDGTLGAIPAGNGRLEALAYLRDTLGADAPVGVGLDEAGEWCVPMIFGADAASQAAAEAFGVDHNNLTIAGAGFTPYEVARMWTTADYVALLERLKAEDAIEVVTVDDDAFTLLKAAGVVADLDPDVYTFEEPGEGEPGRPEGPYRNFNLAVTVEQKQLIEAWLNHVVGVAVGLPSEKKTEALCAYIRETWDGAHDYDL